MLNWSQDMNHVVETQFDSTMSTMLPFHFVEFVPVLTSMIFNVQALNMFLYATQLVQGIFGMRKIDPGQPNRRSVMARKDSQRSEENELTKQWGVEPQHERKRPTVIEALIQQQNAVHNSIVGHTGGPKDSKFTNPANGIPLASPLPKYLMNRTRARACNQSAPEEATFYTKFLKEWRYQRVIGEGGDGIVHQFQQRKHKSRFVAVKTPHSPSSREDLIQEVINMRIVGHHENVLGLLSTSSDWHPYGPALFLPYCELGDLISYRESWCAQQQWQGVPERVSEITMCKLFRDVALALDYLHNKLGTRYIHNDLKPQNILAFMPNDCIGTGLMPEEPVFKLSDFARLTPWPTPHGQCPQGFWGTPEYGPPEKEQLAPIRPPADIWALGATLQYMALGIIPTQSNEAFIWSRKAEDKTYPCIDDKAALNSDYWRKLVPTVYRPINVPVIALRNHYDTPHNLGDYQPFSARLGYWYAQLWKAVGPRPTDRPTAARLVREAIPNLEDQIECLKTVRIKQMQHMEAAAAGKLAELK